MTDGAIETFPNAANIQIGTVMDDNPDRLEATPGKLLPIVVKALQEASAKIEALEDRITSLEGK
jgi:hypothetical protein